ncbi:MAG TPA: porin family protein [Lentimicrobium sp.]|nr:porin family protein [Lentimicrobium sp.]
MRLYSQRIVLTLILISCLFFQANAQHRKVRNLPGYDDAQYHFGFILGMNEMLFTIKTNPGFQNVAYNSLETPDLFSDTAHLLSVQHTPAFGFTIGIVSNLRIADNWDLRFVPSLSFGERDINYVISTNFNNTSDIVYIDKKLQSTFVEFPLNLKFKGSRYNNMRPYWVAGVRYALDLASDSKKKEGNNNINVAIERNDLYPEIGAGLDFYTTYFKFGVELKMAYGLRDILRREGNIYTSGIDSFNSKMFLLSFTFE